MFTSESRSFYPSCCAISLWNYTIFVVSEKYYNYTQESTWFAHNEMYECTSFVSTDDEAGRIIITYTLAKCNSLGIIPASQYWYLLFPFHRFHPSAGKSPEDEEFGFWKCCSLRDEAGSRNKREEKSPHSTTKYIRLFFPAIAGMEAVARGV